MMQAIVILHVSIITASFGPAYFQRADPTQLCGVSGIVIRDEKVGSVN